MSDELCFVQQIAADLELQPISNFIESTILNLPDARKLMAHCRKQGYPLNESQQISDVLGSDKVVLTCCDDRHLLIAAYKEHAIVHPLQSNPAGQTWYTFRHDLTDEWKQWSMGFGLPMMMKEYEIFNVKHIEFYDKYVLAKNSDGNQFVTTTQCIKEEAQLPVLPVKNLQKLIQGDRVEPTTRGKKKKER